MERIGKIKTIIYFCIIVVISGSLFLGMFFGCEPIPMKATIDYYATEYEWVQVAKLTSGVSGSRFGESIAIDGDYIIVGASFENAGQGAAYVFHRQGSSWKDYQRITAGDGVSGDLFGSGVHI